MSVSLIGSTTSTATATAFTASGTAPKAAALTVAEIDAQYKYINSSDFFKGFSGTLNVIKGTFGWSGGFEFTDQNGYKWTRGSGWAAGTGVVTIKRADGTTLKTFSEVTYKPGKFLNDLPTIFGSGVTQFSGTLTDTSGKPVFRSGSREVRYDSGTTTTETLYQVDYSSDYLAGKGSLSATVSSGGSFSATVGGQSVQGQSGSRDFTVNGVKYTGNSNFNYMASIYDQFKTTVNGTLTVDDLGRASFYTPTMQSAKETLNISTSGQRSMTYSGTDYLVGQSGSLAMGTGGDFTLTTSSKTITGIAGTNSFTVTDKATGVTTSYTGAIGGKYLAGFKGRVGTLATVSSTGPVNLTETGTGDIYSADRATGATTITYANYLRYRRTTLGDGGDGTGAVDANGNFSYTDTSGNRMTQDTPVNGIPRIKFTWSGGQSTYMNGTLASDKLIAALKGQYTTGAVFSGRLNVDPSTGVAATFTDETNNKIINVDASGNATSRYIDYLRGKSGTITYDAAGKWTFAGTDGETVTLAADPTYFGSNPPILIKSTRPALAGTGNTEIVSYYKGEAGSGYLASLASALTANAQGVKQAQITVSATGAVSVRNYQTNQRIEIAKAAYSSNGVDWNNSQAQKGTLDLLRGQTGTIIVTADGKISFSGDFLSGSALFVEGKTVNDFIQYKTSPTSLTVGWVGGAYTDFLKGKSGTVKVAGDGKQITFTDDADQRVYVVDIPNLAASTIDINTVSGASDYLVGKTGNLTFTSDGFTLTTDGGETITGKLNDSKLSVTRNGDTFTYQDTAAPYTSTYIQGIKDFLGSKSAAGARLSVGSDGTATFQTTAMQAAGEILKVTALGGRSVTYTGADYLNGLSGTLTVNANNSFTLVTGTKTVSGTIGSTSFTVTEGGITTSYSGAIGGNYLTPLKGKTGTLDTVPVTGSIKFTDSATGLVYSVDKAAATTSITYTGSDYLNGMTGTVTVGSNGNFTFQSGQTLISGQAGSKNFTVVSNGVTTAITGNIAGQYLNQLGGKSGNLSVPGDGTSNVTFTDAARGDVYLIGRNSGGTPVSITYANFVSGKSGSATITADGTFNFTAPWGVTYSQTATQAANGVFTGSNGTSYKGVLIASATLSALKAQFGSAGVAGTLSVDATGAATFQTAAMKTSGETLNITAAGARSFAYSGPDYLNGLSGTLTVGTDDKFTLISGAKTITGTIGSNSFSVTESGITTSYTGVIGGTYLSALKGKAGTLATVPVSGAISFTETATGDIYTVSKTSGASSTTYANYLRGKTVTIAVDEVGGISAKTSDGTVLTQDSPTQIKQVAANGTVSYLSGTLTPETLLTAIKGLYSTGQTATGTLTVAAEGSAQYVDQTQNKTLTTTEAGAITTGVIDYLRGKTGSVVFDATGTWTFYSNDGEVVTQAAGANHKEPAGLGYLTDLGSHLNTTDPFKRNGLIQISLDGTVNFTNFSTNQRVSLTAASYASGHIDWANNGVKDGTLDILRGNWGHIEVTEAGDIRFWEQNSASVGFPNALFVNWTNGNDYQVLQMSKSSPIYKGWVGGAYVDFLKGKSGTLNVSNDGQKVTFTDDKDGSIWQIDVTSEVSGNIDIIRADGSVDYLTGKSGTVQFNGDLFTIGLDNGETVSGQLGKDVVYVKRGSDTFVYHDTSAPYTSTYLQAIRNYAGSADMTGSRLQVAQDGTVTFSTANMAVHSLALEITPTGQQTNVYSGSSFLAGAQGSLTVAADGSVTLDTGSRVIQGQIGSHNFTVTENGVSQNYRGMLGADYLSGLKGLSGTLQLLSHTTWQNFTETATGDVYAVNSLTGETVHNYANYIQGKAGAISIDLAGGFSFTDAAGNSFEQISAYQFKKTSADHSVSILNGTLAKPSLIDAVKQLYSPDTPVTALLSVANNGDSVLIDNDQNKFAQIAADGGVRTGAIDYLRGKTWSISVDQTGQPTFTSDDGEVVSAVSDPTGQGLPTVKSVSTRGTSYKTGYLGHIGLFGLKYMDTILNQRQPDSRLTVAADGSGATLTNFTANQFVMMGFSDAAILADHAPTETIGTLDALRGKTGHLVFNGDGTTTFTTGDGVTYRSISGNENQFSVQYSGGEPQLQNGRLGGDYLNALGANSGTLTVSSDGKAVEFIASPTNVAQNFTYVFGTYLKNNDGLSDFLSGRAGNITISRDGIITFKDDQGVEVSQYYIDQNNFGKLAYTNASGNQAVFEGRLGGAYLQQLLEGQPSVSGRIAVSADASIVYFQNSATGAVTSLNITSSGAVSVKQLAPATDILAGKTGDLIVDANGGFSYTVMTSDNQKIVYQKDGSNPGIITKIAADGSRTEYLDLAKRESIQMLRGRVGVANIGENDTLSFTDTVRGTVFNLTGKDYKTVTHSYIDKYNSGTIRFDVGGLYSSPSVATLTFTSADGLKIVDDQWLFHYSGTDGYLEHGHFSNLTATSATGEAQPLEAVSITGGYFETYAGADGSGGYATIGDTKSLLDRLRLGTDYSVQKTTDGLAVFETGGALLGVIKNGVWRDDPLIGLTGRLDSNTDGGQTLTVESDGHTTVYARSTPSGVFYKTLDGGAPLAVGEAAGLDYMTALQGRSGRLVIGLDGSATLQDDNGDTVQAAADGTVKTLFYADYLRGSAVNVAWQNGVLALTDTLTGSAISNTNNNSVTVSSSGGNSFTLPGRIGGAYLEKIKTLLSGYSGDASGSLNVDQDGNAVWLDRTHNKRIMIDADGTTHYTGVADLLQGRTGILTADANGGFLFDAGDYTLRRDGATGMLYTKVGSQENLLAYGGVGPYLDLLAGRSGNLAVGQDGTAVFLDTATGTFTGFDANGNKTESADSTLRLTAETAGTLVASKAPQITRQADGSKIVTYAGGQQQTVGNQTDALAGLTSASITFDGAGNFSLITASGEKLIGLRQEDGHYSTTAYDAYGFKAVKADGYGLDANLIGLLRQQIGGEAGAGTLTASNGDIYFTPDAGSTVRVRHDGAYGIEALTDLSFIGKTGTLSYSKTADGGYETVSLTVGNRIYRQITNLGKTPGYEVHFGIVDATTGTWIGDAWDGDLTKDSAGLAQIRAALANGVAVEGQQVTFKANGMVVIGKAEGLDAQTILTARSGTAQANTALQAHEVNDVRVSGGGWIAVDQAGNFTVNDLAAGRTLRWDGTQLTSTDHATGTVTALGTSASAYSVDLLAGRSGYIRFEADGSFKFQDNANGESISVDTKGIATRYAALISQNEWDAQKLTDAVALTARAESTNGGTENRQFKAFDPIVNSLTAAWVTRKESDAWYLASGTVERNILHGAWLAARRWYGVYQMWGPGGKVNTSSGGTKAEYEALGAFYVLGGLGSTMRVAFNIYDLAVSKYGLDAASKIATDEIKNRFGIGIDGPEGIDMGQARLGETLTQADQLYGMLQDFDQITKENIAGNDAAYLRSDHFWTDRAAQLSTLKERALLGQITEVEFRQALGTMAKDASNALIDQAGDIFSDAIKLHRYGFADLAAPVAENVNTVKGHINGTNLLELGRQVSNLDRVAALNIDLRHRASILSTQNSSSGARVVVESANNSINETVKSLTNQFQNISATDDILVPSAPSLALTFEQQKTVVSSYLETYIRQLGDTETLTFSTKTKTGQSIDLALTKQDLNGFREKLEGFYQKLLAEAGNDQSKAFKAFTDTVVDGMLKSNVSALNAIRDSADAQSNSAVDFRTARQLAYEAKLYNSSLPGIRSAMAGSEWSTSLAFMDEAVNLRTNISSVSQSIPVTPGFGTSVERYAQRMIEAVAPITSKNIAARTLASLRNALKSGPGFLGGFGYMGQLLVQTVQLGEVLDKGKSPLADQVKAYLEDKGYVASDTAINLMVASNAFRDMAQGAWLVDGIFTVIPGVTGTAVNLAEQGSRFNSITANGLKALEKVGKMADYVSWGATSVAAALDSVTALLEASAYAVAGDDLNFSSRMADSLTSLVGAYPMVGTAIVGFAATIYKDQYISALSSGDFTRANRMKIAADVLMPLGFSTNLSIGFRDAIKSGDSSLPDEVRANYARAGELKLAGGFIAASTMVGAALIAAGPAGWVAAGMLFAFGAIVGGSVAGIGEIFQPGMKPNFDVAFTYQPSDGTIVSQYNQAYDANGNALPGIANGDLANLPILLTNKLNDVYRDVLGEYTKNIRSGIKPDIQDDALPTLKVRTDDSDKITVDLVWGAKYAHLNKSYVWNASLKSLVSPSDPTIDMSTDFATAFVAAAQDLTVAAQTQIRSLVNSQAASEDYAYTEKNSGTIDTATAEQRSYVIVKDYRSDGKAPVNGTVATVANGPNSINFQMNANEGILVYDRNGNGAVDDASELLFLGDPNAAVTFKNDLAWLSENRSAQNGSVTSASARFTSADIVSSLIAVWSDKDHNGRLDTGELTYLNPEQKPDGTNIGPAAGNYYDTQQTQLAGRSILSYTWDQQSGYALSFEKDLTTPVGGTGPIGTQKTVEARTLLAPSPYVATPETATLISNEAGLVGHDRQGEITQPINAPEAAQFRSGRSTELIGGKYGNVPNSDLATEAPVVADEIFNSSSSTFTVALGDLLANDFDRGFQSNIGLYIDSIKNVVGGQAEIRDGKIVFRVTEGNADMVSFDYTVKSVAGGGVSTGRAYIALTARPRLVGSVQSDGVKAFFSNEYDVATIPPTNSPYAEQLQNPHGALDAVNINGDESWYLTNASVKWTPTGDPEIGGGLMPVSTLQGRKLLGWQSSVTLDMRSSAGDPYITYRILKGSEPKNGNVSISLATDGATPKIKVTYTSTPRETMNNPQDDEFTIEAVDMRTGNISYLTFGASSISDYSSLTQANSMHGVYLKSINGSKAAVDAVQPSAGTTQQGSFVTVGDARASADGYFDNAALRYQVITNSGTTALISGLSGGGILAVDTNSDGKVTLEEMQNLELQNLDTNHDGFLSVEDGSNYDKLFVMQKGVDGRLDQVSAQAAGLEFINTHTGSVLQTTLALQATAGPASLPTAWAQVSAHTTNNGQALGTSAIQRTDLLYGTGLKAATQTLNIST